MKFTLMLAVWSAISLLAFVSELRAALVTPSVADMPTAWDV
jgi:hypothetical protein